MSFPRSRRYRLMVTGRLSTPVTELIEERFESAAVIEANPSSTVVYVDGDQASLRAVLTLLWDVGHDVASISQSEDLIEPSDD